MPSFYHFDENLKKICAKNFISSESTKVTKMENWLKIFEISKSKSKMGNLSRCILKSQPCALRSILKFSHMRSQVNPLSPSLMNILANRCRLQGTRTGASYGLLSVERFSEQKRVGGSFNLVIFQEVNYQSENQKNRLQSSSSDQLNLEKDFQKLFLSKNPFISPKFRFLNQSEKLAVRKKINLNLSLKDSVQK